MKYVFSIVLIVLATGCADLKKEEQIERIDEMQKQIDDWFEVMYSGYERPELFFMIQTADSLVVELKNLEEDTISLEEAKTINEFKHLSKSASVLMNLQDQLESQLSIAHRRLKQLKKDINKGSGQRHKYDEYLNEEKKNLLSFKNLVDQCGAIQEDLETNWNSYVNSIEELLNERLVPEEVQ